MKQASQAHPAPEQLLAYGQGRLAAADAAVVSTHLSVCGACRTLFEAGPVGPAPAATGPGHEAPTLAPATQAGVPAALADHPRYRVLELLGTGGMGSVYKAEHRLMERPVALKVMRASLMDRPDAVERFRQEVRAAARLAHPNIVTAHDAEQVGDLHFLVMEFVEGQSLDRVVAQEGPLPVAHACEYARQTALGLQHAHEHGMVHRDIKPHNLMLGPKRRVKILDFGLARFASEEAGSALTLCGALMGTPDYVAPEQANDAHRADIRADLYSLGCTLFHLLAGKPPFPGGSAIQKVVAHLEQPLPPLSKFRADVPVELARVVDRLTAKDPAGRYQTPAVVVRALAPFVTPAHARPTVLAPPAAPAAPAAPPAPVNVLPVAAPPAAPRPAASAAARETPDRPARERPEVARGAGDFAIVAPAEEVGGSAPGSRSRSQAGSDPEDTARRRRRPPAAQLDEPEAPKPAARARRKARRPKKFTRRRVLVAAGGVAALVAAGLLVFVAERSRRPAGPGLQGGLAGQPGYKAVAVANPGRAQMSEDTAALARAAPVKDPSKLNRRNLVILGQQVTAVAFTGDGTKILLGRENGATVLWDVAENGLELKQFTPHTGRVTALAAAVEGTRFVTGGEDKLVRVWDYEGGNAVREYTAHTRPITCVTMSRDGKQVASASGDGFVRVWNADGGADLRAEDFKTTVNTLAFTPAGKLVIGDGNGKISVWGTPIEGKTTEEHTIDLGPIISLAVSPDGGHVLFADASGYARVLHLADGKLSPTGPRHANADLTAVAYAGGVRRAVTAGTDSTLRLWNMGNFTEMARVSVGAVKKLAVAPNANRLLFCTEDGTVFINSLAE